MEVMEVEKLWHERNRILVQLRKVLRLRVKNPYKIKTVAARSLKTQKATGKIDPILAYLFQRLSSVRERLFEYYYTKFKSLLKKAEHLHEDGAQIIAEELLNAIDKTNIDTSDAGFTSYFQSYRLRAFCKIFNLLEDKGVHVSQACRSRMRTVRRAAARICAEKGKVTEEDIKKITGERSQDLLALLNAKRVDLYIEDEDGNIYDRLVDSLTPEKLLLIKEEALAKEEETQRPEFTTTARIFWWNWNQQQPVNSKIPHKSKVLQDRSDSPDRDHLSAVCREQEERCSSTQTSWE